MLRPPKRYRPYTPKHRLSFTVQMKGPHTERQFESFRKALTKLLSRYKAKMTVKKRTPKK
jgi:hypothetical protein